MKLESINNQKTNKSMKYNLPFLTLAVVLVFILLPAVNAISDDEVDYIFPIGENDLKVPCWNNGSYCSSDSQCNFTMLYPNGNVLLDNVGATNNLSYHNYTFDTSTTGLYFTSATCCDTEGCGKETFYVKITPTGDERGVGIFLILSLASVVMLGLAFYLENDYFGFISGALFLIAGIYTMVYGISNFADTYTRTISYVCLGLGILFSTVSGYSMIQKSEEGGSED